MPFVVLSIMFQAMVLPCLWTFCASPQHSADGQNPSSLAPKNIPNSFWKTRPSHGQASPPSRCRKLRCATTASAPKPPGPRAARLDRRPLCNEPSLKRALAEASEPHRFVGDVGNIRTQPAVEAKELCTVCSLHQPRSPRQTVEKIS